MGDWPNQDRDNNITELGLRQKHVICDRVKEGKGGGKREKRNGRMEERNK